MTIDPSTALITQSHLWYELQMTDVEVIDGVAFGVGEPQVAIGCQLCDVSYHEGKDTPCPGFTSEELP